MSGNTMRRRIGMPLVILVVAGAIAVWASLRETGRMQDVEAKVRALCTEVGAGEDLTGKLNPDNPAIEKRIIAALRGVCDSVQTAAIVKIMVAPGDTSGIGGTRIGPEPTHSAVLSIGAHELLGLRIAHRGKAEPLIILGYWDPTAIAAPR